MAERSFWNPMTNVGAFRERGNTIVRGEGSTVWDDAGNALLDVSAALWYCNVGYGRAELADAAAAQMRELSSYKTYDGFTSPKTEQLASHGSNAYGTSLGGMEALVQDYGRLVPEVDQVPWDDAEALAAAIDKVGADHVAAFFAEPVIGAGGVLIPPEGYLDRVQE